MSTTAERHDWAIDEALDVLAVHGVAGVRERQGRRVGIRTDSGRFLAVRCAQTTRHTLHPLAFISTARPTKAVPADAMILVPPVGALAVRIVEGRVLRRRMRAHRKADKAAGRKTAKWMPHRSDLLPVSAARRAGWL